MSELARVLGSEGPGFTLEALGQTWTLTPATQRIKARFETWLEERAEERIKAQREDRDDDWYEEEMDKFRDRRDGGAFRWKGPIFGRKLRSGEGVPYLLALLLGKHHPKEADEEFARTIIEGNAAGVVALLTRIVTDAPNSQPPEMPAASP